MKIKDVRRYLFEAYATLIFSKLDLDQFLKQEIEQKAIVVIDEIDKLVRSNDSSSNSKASDEGVQFDMLPLLDGTSVAVNQKTRIETRNILFVAGGAFEKVKPTDLAVELQGRLPIKTKMQDLSKDDFVAILRRTKYNLLEQNIQLLRTEGVEIVFEHDAVEEIAQVSVELNEEDNIGARRLRTVVDAVLEQINYTAPDLTEKGTTIAISKEYVRTKSKPLYQNRDYKFYIM